MSEISALKERVNTKTFHLFLLSCVTAGLYLNIWMYKTSVAVEEVTGIKPMSTTFLVWYLALYGIGSGHYLSPDPGSRSLAFLLLVAAWFLSIAWCFRIRRAIRAYTSTEHDFELRVNRVFSVLLNFYHISFCINDMQRAKQKRQIQKAGKNL